MTAIIKHIPVGLIAALGVCGLALGGCRPMFTCHQEVLQHIPSPDGKYEALLVKSSCGATTRDMIWVTLKKPDERGTGHLVAVTQTKPSARWTTPRTLQLSPNGNALIPKSKSWQGVQVQLVNNGDYTNTEEKIVEWNGNYEDVE